VSAAVALLLSISQGQGIRLSGRLLEAYVLSSCEKPAGAAPVPLILTSLTSVRVRVCAGKGPVRAFR
jgi:hypothetical protein